MGETCFTTARESSYLKKICHAEYPPCHPELVSGSKKLLHVLFLEKSTKKSPQSVPFPHTVAGLKAFTLAEVLITLAIIGVVAALTIPVITKKAFEQEAVSKVKKHYRNIADIVQQWQVEEGCSENVAVCLEKYGTNDCKNAFTDIEKKLKVLRKRYQNEGFTDIDWLPDNTTLLDGTAQSQGWQGVSKKSGSLACHYLFSDGTTMMVHADNGNKDISIFIDINGKKPPNRVGKDTFPIGIGAYNNPKFTTVHPYYAENDAGLNGLCAIRNNIVCNADVCTQTSCSPTAYVLKYGKLPPISW